VAPAPSKGGRVKAFILVPQKLAVGAHLSKLDPPVWKTGPSDFPCFSEMRSVCGHYVSLISLGYLAFCWAWDFVDNLYSIPLDRVAYLYSRLNIKYISSTWACTRWLLLFHLFLTSWGLSHLILFCHWLLGGCDLEYFKRIINFHFWSPNHFISWLNKDWHLEICDSSWLDWYLEFKHPFALLHYIQYLDAKTPACSSPMHDLSWPSSY
jgi:hypothetical protein